MGYTHHFYRPKSFEATPFNAFVEDVRLFLTHLPNHSHSAGGYYKEYPVIIRGGDGTGQSTVTSRLVLFNGDGKEGLDHEALDIPRVLKPEFWEQPDPEENNYYYQFCKTDRKPYDIVVCAALLSLKYHFPLVTVWSDGSDPKDWVEAVAWYLDCVGPRPLGKGPWLGDEEL